MTDRLDLADLPSVPLVSIIVPCYGQAHFLPDAIESALAQTYQSIEVIVIDDGSPDNTASVAGSYLRVRCVRQENRGPAAARNRGLTESTGECLVFLDADDRLHARALELGLGALKGHRGAAFSYGACEFIDAHGNFIHSSTKPIVKGDHYLRLLEGNFLPNPAAIMFRREPLEALGGFRNGVDGVEDYELCLRLTRIYEASGYHDVVADYRQHGDSLSRKAAVMSESVLAVLRSQADHVLGNRAYEAALRRGLRRWRQQYYAELLVARARENARAGHWGPVIRDTLALLRANPKRLLEDVVRRASRTGSSDKSA